MKAFSLLGLCGVLIANPVFAAESTVRTPEPTGRISSEYEYPELMVSPSASERLSQEAKNEAKNSWKAHWTLESSAILTVIAGVMASSDPGKKSDLPDGETAMTKTASLAAFSIGGGWLALSAFLSTAYSPYTSGAQDVARTGRGTTKREQLAYERRAEEALYRPARISNVLKWASFATNLAAGGLVVSSAKNDMTKIAGGVAVIGSLLPLMFEHPWSEAHRFQNDYKKRIYGPLVYHNVSLVPSGRMLAAEWSVGTRF